MGNNYNKWARSRVKAFENMHRNGVKLHLRFNHLLLRRRIWPSLWRYYCQHNMIGWSVVLVRLFQIWCKQNTLKMALKLQNQRLSGVIWIIIVWSWRVNQRMVRKVNQRPSPTERMRKVRKKSTQFQDKHSGSNAPMLICSHWWAVWTIPLAPAYLNCSMYLPSLT